MRCHIYLFRHGQTHFNRAKRFTGWLDSRWTAEGAKNARTVARKLRKARIDVGFSTRLTRSQQTLREVLRLHPECRLVFIDDRLIERCYGDLQGKSHASFIRQNGKSLFDTYHRSYDIPPPNGESIKMVEKRVRSFIRELITFIRTYHVNVAISAHGNSMRPFRRYFENASVTQMMRWNLPYDDFFEYVVDVPSRGASAPSKTSWKPVHLPSDVKMATDRRNILKKYY